MRPHGLISSGPRCWVILATLILVSPGHCDDGDSEALAWESRTISIEADQGTRVVTATLRFLNRSHQQVRIVSVNPSCGCISTEVGTDVVAAGSRGEVKAMFNVGAKQGREEKYIDITTDEPHSPAYRLNLVVNIPKWIDAESEDLRWPLSSEASEKLIRVWSPLGKPLEITRLDFDEGRFNVKILDENRTAESHVLAVRPVATGQSIQETIRFRVRFNELERDFVFYGKVR
jgi:hypothetical protein